MTFKVVNSNNLLTEINMLSDKYIPSFTDDKLKFGKIHYYAQGGVTCYVIKGERGDLLIDTGFPHIWNGLNRWLRQYDIKHVLLTHAHADHDWNVSKLQKRGVKILLSQKDCDLRQNFLSQKIKPTMARYAARNEIQLIEGRFCKSPAYEADYYFRSNDRNLLHRLGYPGILVPLPGHTYGSVGVYCNGVLYCGDAFTALWKKPDITPHAVSISLMRRSLERIVKISPEWLACGHGLPVRFDDAYPVIEDYLCRTEWYRI